MRDEVHRLPASTYEQAIWKLLSDFGGLDWADDPTQPLPPEARIVADIFWVNEAQLRKDAFKAARSL